MDDIFYLSASKLSINDIQKAALEVKVKSTFIPKTLDVLEIEYCDGIFANWFCMNHEEFQEPEEQSFLIENNIQSIFCISHHSGDLEKMMPHIQKLLTQCGGWIGNDSDGFLPCFNLETDISGAFRIAVNANKQEIIGVFKNIYGCTNKLIVNDSDFVLENNHVVIKPNEDYDAKLAIADDDGYLYYECNIDFYPKKDDIELEMQIRLAKEISQKMKEHGIVAEVIAEFEIHL